MAIMITRRTLLRSTAAGFGSVLLAASANTEPHLTFPKAARERLAVTSWPFRAYIEAPDNASRDRSKPGMDLTEFAAMVKKKFGVSNINPLTAHFRSTDPAYLHQLRTATEKAGSHFVDLGLGGKNFCDPSAAARTEALDYGKKWIDIAQVIGSPSVRQHLHIPKGSHSDPAVAAQNLGELAAYGAKKNIIVLLENDSAISEDPFFIVDVIERAKNPYLRALPDLGNSLQGHDRAFNERAVTAMFKHACNMSHVKDMISKADKEYRVDLPPLFAIAKASGYRGYFSMEVDTNSHDPFEGTQHLVNETLKYI
jgi:sugar phosphate isomerase/epimerase